MEENLVSQQTPITPQPEPQPAPKKPWVIAGVVVIVILTIGIGILIWQQRKQPHVIEPGPTPPFAPSALETELFPTESISPSPLPQNESGQAGRYVNKVLGVDFAFPVEWGALAFDKNGEEYFTQDYNQNTQTVYFTPSNKRIAQVALHIPTMTVVFIEREESAESPRPHPVERGTKMSQLLKDGGTKYVYTVEQKYKDFGGEGVLSYVHFSPSGRYVDINLFTSIETGVKKFFDLETGRDLFGRVCLNEELTQLIKCLPDQGPHGVSENAHPTFEEFIGGVYWSDDEKVLVISIFPDYAGGNGLGGLFISDYNNPEKMNIGFTRDKPSPPLAGQAEETSPGYGTIQFLNIEDIRINKEGSVSFTTSVSQAEEENSPPLETREFEYNTKTKTLKQLSYNPRN